MARKSISKPINAINIIGASDNCILQGNKNIINRINNTSKGGHGCANWRMNKLLKILLATLGGVEAVFYMVTPILIALMWATLFSFESFGNYVIYATALIASIFRGIKVGWLKK